MEAGERESWRRRLARRTWVWRVPIAKLLARRATARWRTLPDFFIVGATKAGTSSLANYVAGHPAYVRALTKELMFLQELPNFWTNHEYHRVVRRLWGDWRQGVGGYRKFFPLSRAMRAVTRRVGERAITGDHTPFYLYSPIVARRILEFRPRARFIVLLRDPVDRAYSDYNMLRSRSERENRTFEQALDDELRGACRDFRLTYLHQGVYEPHLREWRRRVSEAQLLIIPSESFFDPARTAAWVETTFRFLGLSPVATAAFPVVNKGTYREPMQDETRQRLREYFQPWNDKLYEFLGVDFGWQRPE